MNRGCLTISLKRRMPEAGQSLLLPDTFERLSIALAIEAPERTPPQDDAALTQALAKNARLLAPRPRREIDYRRRAA